MLGGFKNGLSVVSLGKYDRGGGTEVNLFSFFFQLNNNNIGYGAWSALLAFLYGYRRANF